MLGTDHDGMARIAHIADPPGETISNSADAHPRGVNP